MVKKKPLKRPQNWSIDPAVIDKDSAYTAPDALGRFFYINLGILRFGTDDKFQSVAFIFGIIFVLLWIVVGWKGFSSELADKQWAKEWSTSIQGLLAGIVGVAIGRSLK